MGSNSRLAVAVHTAGILALRGRQPVTSDMVATSVGTNPVVVRRIIGCLVKSGIAEVRKGSGGGAFLTRPANAITIADIYAALGEDELFQVPSLGKEHECPIGRAVRPILHQLFSGAEEAMIGYLAGINLEDLIKMLGEDIPDGICGEISDD